MAKPDRKKWPTLAAAWDAYGHSIAWEKLFDMKVGSHGYVALAWKEADGMVNYADLATGDNGKTWEMQNDGHEDMSEAKWKRMCVASECDWLVDPKGDNDE